MALMQKSLEDLEKEIVCVICGDYYVDPRVLPCCHYYCKECVYKVALRTGLSKPFSCPECRVNTSIPQGCVDNFPKAFFINRMKDLFSKLKIAQRKVESKCGVCSAGLKVSAYCQQCAQFICNECVRSHQRINIFSNHVVTALDSLTEVETSKLLAQESSFQVCGLHGQPMDLFCFDCTSLICHDCSLRDHFTHSHDSIKKAALQTKEGLIHQLSPLQNLVSCLSKANVGIQTLRSEITGHGNFLTGEIRSSFKELHKILEDREEELLNEVSLQIHQKLEHLSSQEQTIVKSKSVVSGVIDYVEHCLQHCSDAEVMTMQTEITERLEKIMKEQKDDTKFDPVEEINVITEICCAQDLQHLCQSKAVVKVLSVDPSKCTVSGSGFRFAEVGKLTEFKVVTRLYNGECTKQPSIVRCSIESAVNGLSVDCRIDRPKLGEYLVQYLPTVRGHTYLTVEVNGQEIAGSPFCVSVYMPPSELNQPVKVINKLSTPHGVAVNSAGDILVTEWSGGVLTFDKTGKKLVNKCIGRSDYKFDRLAGIDVDKSDNVYVLDKVNLIFKFNKQMDLVKKVKHSSASSNLSGITVFNEDKLLVCDRNINCISIYDTDLVHIKKISSHCIGSRHTGVFDLSVDCYGNLYLSHCGNQHIQVISSDGQLLRIFGMEDGDKFQPRGISVAGQFVYVANETNHKLHVYSLEGEFVASIGKWGTGRGDFYSPSGVCVRDGFVYMCDRFNDRLQIL